MEQIINETPITMFELKTALEKIKKQEKELNFRSNKTLDFLNKFSSFDKKKADELKKKIQDLKIPRFKDQYIIKIIDLMPDSLANLKLVLQGYSISITNDNLKKMLDILKDYLPKE